MRISTVLRIGAIIICVGAWIRNITTLTSTFWPVIVGTTILSCPGPIILSAVTPVCNKWFGDKERSTATAILGLPSPLGAVVGLVMGGVFFLGVSFSTPLETIHSLERMIWWQNWYITGSTILFCLVMRDHPKIPPSAVALQNAPVKKLDKMIFEALKNKNYCIIILEYGIFYGVYLSLGALLSPIFEPYGYSNTEISMLGVEFIISGVISCMVVGCLLDRYSKFLVTLRVVCWGSTVVAMVCTGLFPLNKIKVTTGLMVLAGIILLPIIPVCISFASEVTFPM
jgi:sugar phosphate permease